MSSEEGDALLVMLGSTEADKLHESDVKEVKPIYEDEWNDLSKLAEGGLQGLREFTARGGLCRSRFRSIVWQILLGSLPTSPSLWVPMLRQQRNTYRLLRQRYTIDPRQTEPGDNPLSQSSNSIWHQYFCDKELRAMIRQDVIRTFPAVDFFRSESIHCTMINVLFCYAREHPELCYRQGMHEVLAPLLYVLHCDHQSLLRTQELTSVSAQAVEILDPTCLEEDAYWLFSIVMSNVVSSYRVRNVTPLLTGHFPTIKSSFNNSEQAPVEVESEVSVRLKWIFENLLQQYDPELYQHIVSLDIPFQTFGIRWLRVLFGQEFPLLDLLYVWDAIFAEDDNFGLVNYIVVSMILAIRDLLLVEDDTECLLHLMKYPGGVDVQKVVQHALHMRRPQKYAAPRLLVEEKKITASNVLRRGKNVNSLSGRLKKFTLWSHRRGAPPAQLSTHGGTKLSASSTSTNSNVQRTERSEGRGEIIEGFTRYDPAVIQAELQHCHTLLSLVYTHLKRYHSTLEETLQPNCPPKAVAALAGIRELCFQLSQSLPSAPNVLEVETASEAEPAATPPSETRTSANGVSVDVSMSRGTLTKPSVSPCELTLKHVGEGSSSEVLPLEDPLRELYIDYNERDWHQHSLYCRHLGVQL